MAHENWLHGKQAQRAVDVVRNGPTPKRSSTPDLSVEEYATAGASALAGPGGLGMAPMWFARNVAERRAWNQKTGAAPLKVPPAPSGVSVDSDMREAARRGDPLWFFNQVRKRGPKDYKYRGRGYDDFGNFVFGAAGTALGLSPEVLRRGAGAGQLLGDAKKVLKGERGASVKASNGVPWGSYPYGDNANDQPNIDLGIRYAKGRGY